MHKESCTKHEAIEKAKTLITLGHTSNTKTMMQTITPPITSPEVNNTDYQSRIVVLSKLMYEAKESLTRSTKAQEYCKQRGLDSTKLEIGFLEQRYYSSWNEPLKRSAIEAGLLKELPNNSLSPVFRSCIIFPIKNQQGQIISIYGRSITDNKESRHFYLKGKHQGLYPAYPNPSTKTLIIIESIIDTASLQQLQELSQIHSLLALYGTNGLTEEHIQAIKQLTELQEIIFMLNADEAGNKAVEKYSEQLHHLLPETCGERSRAIKISKVALPDGEDVNSLLQGHDAAIVEHILQERKIISSNEKNNISPIPVGIANPELMGFNTSNPERIIYTSQQLAIEIWGGIEYNNLHRLRLSLHIENKATGRSLGTM